MLTASTASTFKTDEPLLYEVLTDIGKGRMQLPDFQRPWVWDDKHIRDLIASVSMSYPIGAIMVLETGGDGVRFKPHPIEGVRLASPPRPTVLILDGQQRLTALFLSLCTTQPVKTTTEKKEDIERLYYLDMRACLDPTVERLDAVLSIPASKVVTSDFGRKIDLDVRTPQDEFRNGLFPLHLMFDHVRSEEWQEQYREYNNDDKAAQQVLKAFKTNVWLRFQQYKLPLIVLQSGTPKEAVCHVFEKVNTGGVTLSVFELVTATFAADDFRLRDDWERRERPLHEHPVLSELDGTSFLTAVTLRVSFLRSQDGVPPVGCKRKDVLDLELRDYQANADAVEAAFLLAGQFVVQQKVLDARGVPYDTQLVPLAAIASCLGGRFKEDAVRAKVARWYWCGVFGELYGGANETRYAFDIQDVLRWVDGGELPRTVVASNFAPVRLLTLQSRLSAAYKGLAALLLQQGCRDFLSAIPAELDQDFLQTMDIHHVFPRAYCEKVSVPWRKVNSIVNKTILSARTNRLLGGHAPGAYLGSLETNHCCERARLDESLRSHVIEPGLLRQDDFAGFFIDRATRLLDLIEAATGKPISGRDSEEVVQAFGNALVLPPAVV